MGYTIKIKTSVRKDLKKIANSNLKKKFEELLKLLKDNPYQNPPPYEKLTGNLKDKYSRRLNIQHRLVYSVDEKIQVVTIFAAWTHYE